MQKCPSKTSTNATSTERKPFKEQPTAELKIPRLIVEVWAQRVDDNVPCILTYPLGNTDNCNRLQYDELLRAARTNAGLLQSLDGVSSGSVVLLYFQGALDNILWFWSTVYV
jgi:acyl-coenzyme A synthetase/AMP-(fatty) acid ligase